MDLNKLLKTGDTCITDEPSACTALCPIHIDVRSFIDEIIKGDFKKAYKIMAKKMPLPRIIGKICDHPCENVCLRKDLGGAINIAELEKITVDLGFSPKKKSFVVPKNGKKVAVIGGGISGIMAADSLESKGYRVTIYESTEKIGGKIWEYQDKNLTKEIIEEELKIFSEGDINIKLNEKVKKKELESIVTEYDAVYLGTGFWEEALKINLETFQIEESSVFAGGGLLNIKDSIIYSISSGRRAALSIDRYIHKTSMTASREREGSYITPLTINIDSIKVKRRVEKTSDKYSDEEAIKEAQRCLKCQCLNCVKSCSHLKKYNVTPKSYIRQINHNETIVLGDHYANEMINSCTLCGLCKEICPSCINMKDIITETRESMVEREKMPVSAHDFAIKDMEFSNSSYFSMAKNQPEQEKVEYVFYPGCQLPASYPEYIEKIYTYLMLNIKDGVGLILGCCGAPADWAGRQDLMKDNIDNIKNNWEVMGKPTFILACSSCCSIFEKYMPEIKFISLWEIMDKYGIPTENKIYKKHILNIHDACSTRHNKKIHESIRNIVCTLGYDIEELKFSREKAKCCGYGGLVYFANKEQAEEFVKDRIGESGEDYLVYCTMCKDLFVSKGKRTYHILDLIYGEDLEDVSLRKAPTLSKRHDNRTAIKTHLLKKIWNEEINNLNRNHDLKLIVTDAVQKQMEDRLILLEDVEKVLYNAEKNRERFFNPQNSHYLARKRINNVTFWVEYEKNNNELLVHSVYTHRMEVLEE